MLCVPAPEQDFGGGGAYPEIMVAQYPLDMGRKDGVSKAWHAQRRVFLEVRLSLLESTRRCFSGALAVQ